MKTFMDYLSEAIIHPPNAINQAFGEREPAVGPIIPSSSKDIKGARMESAYGIVRNTNGVLWNSLKQQIEKQIERFSEFEKSNRGFLNVENPLIRNANGNTMLVWYKPSLQQTA